MLQPICLYTRLRYHVVYCTRQATGVPVEDRVVTFTAVDHHMVLVNF